MTQGLWLWCIGIGLLVVPGLLALPWLAVLGWERLGLERWRERGWGAKIGGLLSLGAAGGLVLAVGLSLIGEPQRLEFWGRVYGSVVHVQLVVDAFLIAWTAMVWGWPKGGAVALAAFRESVRQPLFLFLTVIAAVFLLVTVVLPYFTLSPGDEYKMVKQLGSDIVMLAAGGFALLAASQSLTEEIEGRTAVTLMSKPVSRREFILGKYLGLLLAALALTAVLAWGLDWCLYIKLRWEEGRMINPPPPAPGWLEHGLSEGPGRSFVRGAELWFRDSLGNAPAVVAGFGQVMVLLALAVALATRLPMIVTLVICLTVYFLGHLAPILVQVARTQPGLNPVARGLLQFVAQLFDFLLPALELFQLGPVVVRDLPTETTALGLYLGSVLLYAALYSATALLAGLLLFEDRDLA
ncbi:MAG: ABC transporter permease [Gemmataceae bacterium]|nr:ABC transporter permease [Gemmataceae bacterium]MDW8265471.1 ABC transporter permease subunit [Gemmataceae bacterium]